MPQEKQTTELTFQELRAADAGDLQAVYATVPGYYALFGGLRPDEAYQAITHPPEVASPHYAWGIRVRDELVGHLDFVLGYPDPLTAYLGLLLIRGDRHGRGLGRQAFERWLAWVMTGPFRRVRLGVVVGNEAAMAFWRRVGCRPTGEIRPLVVNDREVSVHLYEYAF